MAKSNGYTATALKQLEYWYKINGKNTTKAGYNAYKNKPGGDGSGKSTNDPDASGNKAKIKKNRSNNAASKKPTALTKAQTTAKGGVSPPFKQKVNGKPLPKGYTEKDKKFLDKQKEDVVRREDLDAKGKAIYDANLAKAAAKKKTKKSPLEFGWKDALDAGQLALTAGGMVPGWGIVPDAINTVVSGGRAAYAKATGNKEETNKHMLNMGLNAAMMIPAAGQAVASSKLALNAAGKTKKVLDATKKATDITTKVLKGNKYGTNSTKVGNLTKKLIVGKGNKNAYNLVSGKGVVKAKKLGGKAVEVVSGGKTNKPITKPKANHALNTSKTKTNKKTNSYNFNKTNSYG